MPATTLERPATGIARLRPLTADELLRMAEAGLFRGERVELIDGTIRAMSPIGPVHIHIVNRLTNMLARHLPEGMLVSVQNSLRLDDLTEPEPDLVVLKVDAPTDRVPHPEDALLVVEVAVSTLAYDRDVKLPRYAAAEIPEVWIVDADADRVDVYREPTGDRYKQRRSLGRGDALHVAAAPEAGPFEVTAVLG